MDAKATAFIGLGVMGFPMAGHLARAGHRITVYNRTPAKAAQWIEKHGGKSAPTPAAAAAGADFVMLCVGNDDDVRAAALASDGALSAMKAGAILVDHTTASASVAREVYAAAKARSVRFLDAPVSGASFGALVLVSAVNAGPLGSGAGFGALARDGGASRPLHWITQ